jgi:hypothetical protein
MKNMKKLDLFRIWEVCNILNKKRSELCEEEVYLELLGVHSNYIEESFKSFLGYYSFRIEDDNIVIFNDDKIPWEDFTNSDFSEIPLYILDLSEGELNNWIASKIELELSKQEQEEELERQQIKQNIELLQKQLNAKK